MEALANKFEKLINDNEMSPEQFAKITGLSKGAVSKLRSGQTKTITISTTKKINKAFPEYSIKYLRNLNDVSNSMDKTIRYDEPEERIIEVAKYVAEHQDQLLNDSLFRAVLESIFLRKEFASLLKKFDFLSKKSNSDLFLF